jgi:hypothetical protein
MRRIAASKDDEVGQMRRRSGTSMKRIMKEQTLERDGELVVSYRKQGAGWMKRTGR